MRAQDRQPGSGSDRLGAAHAGRTASSPASDAARQAAAGGAERLAPEAAAALQRAVGNATFPAVLAGRKRHRHSAGCGHAAHPTVQRSPVQDVLRTPGRPLDDPVRTDMETRLGADFSDVRVHTDAFAHESAESVDAHAYTSGSPIVFRRDRYDTSPTAAIAAFNQVVTGAAGTPHEALSGRAVFAKAKGNAATGGSKDSQFHRDTDADREDADFQKRAVNEYRSLAQLVSANGFDPNDEEEFYKGREKIAATSMGSFAATFEYEMP